MTTDPFERAFGLVSVRTKPCPHCGQSSIVMLPVQGILDYRKGALIQDAFPDTPAARREQFQTGFHPACWNEIFPPDEED